MTTIMRSGLRGTFLIVLLASLAACAYLPKNQEQYVAAAQETLTAANNVYAKLLDRKKADGTLMLSDKDVACIDLALSGAKSALTAAKSAVLSGASNAKTLAENALQASKALEAFLLARQAGSQDTCKLGG